MANITKLTKIEGTPNDNSEQNGEYRVDVDNKLLQIISPSQRMTFGEEVMKELRKILNSILSHEDINLDDLPRQIIYYGAPGTGKSYTIDKKTSEANSIRTTFHPDSDYSTFVGAYKPTMNKSRRQVILDYTSLVDKFKEYLAEQPVNITRACTMFGYDFHDSIISMQENGTKTIPSLVDDAYKSGTTYDSQVRAGMSVYENIDKTQDLNDKIIYSFVPQAFLKAYCEAWKTTEPVYLIIEEINRGNCAQIFGDIFQLLDRCDNGYSSYAIQPDEEISRFIKEDTEYGLHSTDVTCAENDNGELIATAEEIKNGKKLVLPPNLYIWATMNTSYQSLFPIDSAFKRRWEWEYMPIVQGRDKEGNLMEWTIDVNGGKYRWWSFIEKINAQIGITTKSEDKKLGFFFCKAKNGVITPETFVGKVVFYLWNDVFKDYGFEGPLFKDSDGTELSFNKFYTTDAKGEAAVNQDKVALFLTNLGVEKVETSTDEDREEE